jgi:uncharacterized protein YndB with AHSA1/START domain
LLHDFVPFNRGAGMTVFPEPTAEHVDRMSVERLILAPPERIFDLLADPSRHCEIDGSGAVRQPKSQNQRLALGSTFVMSMKMGIPYATANTVVDFEENRRIAWQTFSTITWIARWGGGRIWRYELQPDHGGTLVRETWDITHEAPRAKRNLEKTRTRRYMTRAMQQSLARLEEVMLT